MVDEGLAAETPDDEPQPRALWRLIVVALLVVAVGGAVGLAVAVGLGALMAMLASFAASWVGLPVTDVLLATVGAGAFVIVLVGLRMAWLLSDMRDVIRFLRTEEDSTDFIEVVQVRQPSRRRRSRSTKRRSS